MSFLFLGLLILLAIIVLWLWPILWIARDQRTSSLEKLLWILAILCISWFAWIIYYFIAPVLRRD